VIWKSVLNQIFTTIFQAKLIPERDSTNLIIALEPEAASLYCRTLDVNHFIDSDRHHQSAKFQDGTVYMVIDAGGKRSCLIIYYVFSIL
jgi:hypothetical protein